MAANMSTTAATVFKCPLCADFAAVDFKLLLPHIRLVHSTRPGFSLQCSIDNCTRIFRNMKTYTNHIYGDHMSLPRTAREYRGQTSILTSMDDGDGEDVDDMECEQSASVPTKDLTTDEEYKKMIANWLLKIKECSKLTQATLNIIIEGVTDLNQFILTRVGKAVTTALKEAGINPTRCPQLSHIFDINGQYGRPFQGLETSQKQLTYVKKRLGYVEPKSIVLGSFNKWVGRGRKRNYKPVFEKMVYVPILRTIETLLQDPVISDEIALGHANQDGTLSHFSDGQFFKSSEFFKTHPTGLQINLYYDDVEICNPLGSKRTIHKLGFFYFLFNNLPPHMRSKINSIQLIAIVKSRFIKKYSMKEILRPIIKDLKKLEDGVELVVNGKPNRVYGTVVTVCADNPGSCALGGFKESGSAYRFCRQCLITCDDIKKVAHEAGCTLRTPSEYNRHCSEVEQDSSNSKSKEHGINSRSILNDLKYFHTCNGQLLPDIMHDVLEGGLQYEAKLMLRQFVLEDKYCTLDQVNFKIENFDYGYMEVKNRPTPISSNTLTSTDNSLKQNASQMWLLGRSLPALIGSYIPLDDEHWENFCDFIQITQILFAPKIRQDDLARLQELIMHHHQQFIVLYPNHTVIPKMHFLIHTPRMIYQFGPLVHQWCMRYEAKHKYFKTLAGHMGNFINAPHSLAKRHQTLQCYLHQESTTFNIPVFTKGTNMSSSQLPFLADLLQNNSMVFSVTEVDVNGVTYKPEVVLAINPARDIEEPSFGLVKEIFVAGHCVHFYLQELSTSKYDEHYSVYVTKATQRFKLLSYDSLSSYLPLSSHKLQAFPGHLCIIPKFIIV